MVTIFYRSSGAILMSQSMADLDTFKMDDGIWIDLFSPSGDEKRATEKFLNTEIQSRARAEEIESSSRFSETETAIFANTNFLIPGPEEYSMEPVSFTLVENVLTTLRDVPLRSFTELQRKMQALPRLFPNGYWVFVNIMDQRVDLDADMIELMSKEIALYSRRVNQQEDINEAFLLDINQLQENTMLLRETIVDKQRVISSILKSPKCPKSIQNKLNVMLKDISSLVNHTNFSFERLEYLQNTVLGIINLDQNKIMKVFTLISLLLMPPTLIASFYGMNVALPIIPCDSPWNWVIIISMMIISVLIVFFLLKRKKLL